MTITPEIIAKLIFGISSLRHWEKEYAKEPGAEIRKLVTIWQIRLDELIEQIGATEYQCLKDILSELKIETYDGC